MNKQTILIIIIVAVLLHLYFHHQKERFRLLDDTLRSGYEPVQDLDVPGLKPYIKRYNEVQNYADEVAYGLQHPVPNSAIGYSNAPWNPNSYELRELPDGQFVGDISAN